MAQRISLCIFYFREPHTFKSLSCHRILQLDLRENFHPMRLRQLYFSEIVNPGVDSSRWSWPRGQTPQPY